MCDLNRMTRANAEIEAQACHQCARWQARYLLLAR